jgi:hypothetical protein
MTLAADLTVDGVVTTPALPEPSRSVSADGYDITLDRAPRRAGSSELAFSVRRGGTAVRTDLYLGAAGHLVAIRDGDLAYLHVHPLADRDDVAAVRFLAEFPSAGTYRLFFDFAHDGDVHTAAFTAHVGEAGSEPVDSDEHEGH